MKERISNDITDATFSTPRGVQDITGIDKSAMKRLLMFGADRAEHAATCPLDAVWADVEAALPEGAWLAVLSREWPEQTWFVEARQWATATAAEPYGTVSEQCAGGVGTSVIDALRDLLRELRDPR